MIDYTIDERTGQIVNPGVLGDGNTVKTFDEYWTLVRKVGAGPSPTRPSRSAELRRSGHRRQLLKCAYCGTMMNDPALDWVLLRIEQP